ncbi:hypothetical protein H4582DRAFT_952153 [Lactarius indigo]|nr:hypothetical protein H4582DRAFT_952153 [Lactarius indigo]
MMFPKSLVSFVAAMALAGGIAVSANPLPEVLARGDTTYPPPPVPTVSQCNTGPVQCCNTFTSTSNPLTALLSGLLPIGAIIDPNLGVGLGCLPILSSIQCANAPVCCNGISQSGLINVGCSPINLGL